jgi:hypothetical protein
MRRHYTFGLLAGLAGLSSAQDPAPPTSLMPTFKGGTPAVSAPAAGGAVPFSLTPVFAKPELKQQRPEPGWELKPEHGEWLIEVQSYAQVESGLMAQALAKEIRDRYKAPVYIFEWAAEARAKKEAEENSARKRMEEELRPFVEFQAKLRAEAEARGEVFDETPIRVKVPAYYREIPDQYLVLVGGYKDIETARKALDIIKKWPIPSDTRLLNQVERQVVKDGKKVFEASYVNPFADARVVRNLTWPKQQIAQRDEFLLRLNESEPLSICRSKSKYTMVVKAFNCPVSKAGSDEETKSAGRGPKAGMARPGQWLDATAQQAQELCNRLRSLKDLNNQPIGFEAHVLHHRTGSCVTVGQYESPDEAKLKSDFDRIWRMSFQKHEAKGDKPGQVIPDKNGLFDVPYLMEIPR